MRTRRATRRSSKRKCAPIRSSTSGCTSGGRAVRRRSAVVAMPTDPSRLLLIKLSSIGDVVHALPVAAALRRRFPRAYLAWAVKPAAAEVVIGNPHLDEVLVVGGREAPGATALPPLTRA